MSAFLGAGAGRRYLLLLVAIAVAGFVLRVGLLLERGLDAPLSGDEHSYTEAASSLASGSGFTLGGVPTTRRMPGWPLVLAGPYLMFGATALVARLTSCVLGALVVLPIGLAALRLGGRDAGILAAGAAALYPPMVVYSTKVLTETPTVFWLALAIWLLFEGHARDRWTWIFGSGLAFGFGCLTRGTVVAFLGAGCLALIAVPRREWFRGFTRAGLLGTGAVLVLSPWIARNAIVFARPCLSSQSKVQLWQGAHPGATGLDPIDWPMTTRKMEETRYLGEFGRSDLMGREASAFIREHPAEFARLGLVKAWELWKPGSPRVGRVENLVYALSAVPLLILGLASAFARERSAFERSFAVFGLGLFTIMHMVYTAIVRYRVPADALLIVYAAVLLTDLRARRGRLI